MTEDILFIESTLPEEVPVGPIDVSIKGMFTNAQLKSLSDVKILMAAEAKRIGANCIVNFKYGQKSSIADLFFNLDDVSWYGTGLGVKLNNIRYGELKPKRK